MPTEPHSLQSPLPYSMDAFVDVNHGMMLSKNEVETMYLVEHRSVVELAEQMSEKASTLLAEGKIGEWEPWAKKLRGLQNE